MDLASKLFKGDRVIWLIFMFLCLVSLVEVFSATSTLAYRNANHWAPIVRHASFLLVGFICVLILHNVPTKYLSVFTVLLPVSVIMLLITPIIGEEVNGAGRWLWGIQPSEIAKLASVVYIAFILSRTQNMTGVQRFKYILFGVGLVCLLILPENFSTAFMLFGVCFLMMFVGQLPIKLLLKTVVVLILGGILFLSLCMAPDSVHKYLPDRFNTWKARIERFSDTDPWTQKVKSGDFEGLGNIPDEILQETHAKIAIARGGIVGHLPGYGQQRDFLPQAYSDFIYAIIIEEMGVAGGLIVLFLYVFLLIRVGIIARKCDKLFPKYLVLGCGLLIVIQAVANMSVAVGLIPVTGQPLPLVSRGGTSTILSCVYIGIILSVSRFSAKMGEEEGEDEETTEEANVEEVVAESNNGRASLESIIYK